MTNRIATIASRPLFGIVMTAFGMLWAQQIYGAVGNHPVLSWLYIPMLAVCASRVTYFVTGFLVLLILIEFAAPRFPGADVGLAIQAVLLAYWCWHGVLLREVSENARVARIQEWIRRTARPFFAACALLLAGSLLFRSFDVYDCVLWFACCAVIVKAIPSPHPLRMAAAIGTTALTLVSLGFSVVVLEVGARLLVPPPVVSSEMYAPDPVNIFTLNPNARGAFYLRDNDNKAFEVEALISSQGVRDREIGPKAADEYRIVMIGDSYTMGHGLTPDQNIPHQLEKRLNASNPPKRITVVNCGVGGYAPWQERAFLNARGFQFEPDLVILQVFPANDVAGTLTRVNKYLMVPDLAWEARINEFRRQNEWPVLTQRWLQSNSRIYAGISSAFDKPDLARDVINDLRFLPDARYDQPMQRAKRNPYREASLVEWYPELEEAYRLMEEDIRGIRDDCRARGVDLIAYAHPFPMATMDDGWEEFDAETKGSLFEPNKDVRVTQEIFARAEIPFVNVTEALEAAPDKSELYFKYDGHFSPAGAAVVASALADYLINQRQWMLSDP
ncbi:MAG TPA: GDSL-type esterase/lipase family protein [Candidatus Hydrogenedentes bacterium]|nr:GDSL-type esterase/lipase family protein [Candidatus Hydrogenedentota bacterium]